MRQWIGSALGALCQAPSMWRHNAMMRSHSKYYKFPKSWVSHVERHRKDRQILLSVWMFDNREWKENCVIGTVQQTSRGSLQPMTTCFSPCVCWLLSGCLSDRITQQHIYFIHSASISYNLILHIGQLFQRNKTIKFLNTQTTPYSLPVTGDFCSYSQSSIPFCFIMEPHCILYGII